MNFFGNLLLEQLMTGMGISWFVESVSMSSIDFDNSPCQTREHEVKPSHVATLLRMLGSSLLCLRPVLIRVPCGKDGRFVYRIVCGRHRLHALRELGISSVEAYIIDASDPNATLDNLTALSSQSNIQLGETDEERFRCAVQALIERNAHLLDDISNREPPKAVRVVVANSYTVAEGRLMDAYRAHMFRQHYIQETEGRSRIPDDVPDAVLGRLWQSRCKPYLLELLALLAAHPNGIVWDEVEELERQCRRGAESAAFEAIRNFRSQLEQSRCEQTNGSRRTRRPGRPTSLHDEINRYLDRLERVTTSVTSLRNLAATAPQRDQIIERMRQVARRLQNLPESDGGATGSPGRRGRTGS